MREESADRAPSAPATALRERGWDDDAIERPIKHRDARNGRNSGAIF
jgi:hypothetical protein